MFDTLMEDNPMFKQYILVLCALLVPFMPSTIQATQNNEVILFHKPSCPYCTYINPLFNQLANQTRETHNSKRST